MNEGKEDWVNNVLGSIDGIKPAAPDPALYQKIMRRIASEGQGISIEMISAGTLYHAAAAVLLIITLNVYTCLIFSSSGQSSSTGLKGFANEYSLVNDNYNY